MKKLLLLATVALAVAACDIMGDDFTIKPCSLIEPGQEAATQRAWAGFKKDAAMIAFAINKGVIKIEEGDLIKTKGQWPEGAYEIVSACFE